MSKVVDALPLIAIIAIALAFYFFADQIFMMLYDLSEPLSKYL